MTLTETEGILDLLKKSELARDKCSKVLSGSISLKVGCTFVLYLEVSLKLVLLSNLSEVIRFFSAQNVEELLHEFDGFISINIPELNILRQYHVEALSWISRFNDTMIDVREGKDQQKLISDLSSLLHDGASLGIQGLTFIPRHSFAVSYLVPSCFCVAMHNHSLTLIKVSEIVEGLPLVEVELKKASCREKARTVNVFSVFYF